MSGNTNTYSLFNNTESPWQAKNPNENISHQVSNAFKIKIFSTFLSMQLMRNIIFRHHG